MSKGRLVSTDYSTMLTTEDGTQVESKATANYAPPPTAKKLNARIHTMDFLDMMTKVAKSSKDIYIVKKLIEEADIANEIKLVNTTQFAKDIGVGVATIKRILSRSCESGLFYKISTGHYMLNPYVLLSKGLTSRGNEAQRKAQLKWDLYDTTTTESDRLAIEKLQDFLNVEELYVVPFVIKIANYYASKGKVSDKQKAIALEYVVPL